MKIGDRVYRLLVVSEAISVKSGKRNRKRWKCICDCGKETVVYDQALKIAAPGKGARSCGCLKMELSTKHGLSKTPEYKVWLSMRKRCNSPASESYKHYGGRGITVCDTWEDFEAFLRDMGPRPSNRHSIERRDNNAGYSKNNCVWATSKEQNRNRRGVRLYRYDGADLTLGEIGTKMGVKRDDVRQMFVTGELKLESRVL